MLYNYFDEIKIGDKVVSRGRTVTEADVVLFCMFTGNWLEIHSNAEFAKSTRWKKRIVQGTLVFSWIPGLLPVGTAGRIIAFYGVDKIRFIAPVWIGDTVHVEAEVVAKDEKDENSGVVTQSIAVKNQRGETVQVSIFRNLVAKKPKEA